MLPVERRGGVQRPLLRVEGAAFGVLRRLEAVVVLPELGVVVEAGVLVVCDGIGFLAPVQLLELRRLVFGDAGAVDPAVRRGPVGGGFPAVGADAVRRVYPAQRPYLFGCGLRSGDAVVGSHQLLHLLAQGAVLLLREVEGEEGRHEAHRYYGERQRPLDEGRVPRAGGVHHFSHRWCAWTWPRGRGRIRLSGSPSCPAVSGP